MASVYVTEFGKVKQGFAHANAQIADLDTIGTVHKVTIGATAQTGAFAAGTAFVRIETEGDVSFAYGSNPTATTAGSKIPANGVEYFGVTPGNKLAFITN